MLTKIKNITKMFWYVNKNELLLLHKETMEDAQCNNEFFV